VMQFRVKVDSQADFDAWATNQAKPAPVIADAAAKRGEGVFVTKSCVGCHAITGHPDRNANVINKKIGPNLTHYNSRSFLAGGALENTPENLARWLRNPEEVKSGNLMSSVVKPGFLSEQEVQDLVAYLRTLN
jgi:cytochrome c oxidase subunit II